jgi:hypothetical protein
MHNLGIIHLEPDINEDGTFIDVTITPIYLLKRV